METTRGDATLTITPFSRLATATRRDLEAEAEQLVRFMGPEATRHRVAWAPSS